METTIDFSEWLKQIIYKIKAQIIALNELADIFEDVARRLSRHDQADYLCMLKVRIIKEVEYASNCMTRYFI